MLEAHLVELEVAAVIGEAHKSAELPVEGAAVEEGPFLPAEAPGKQAQGLLQMQLAALECTQQ